MNKSFNEFSVMRLIGALIFIIGAVIVFFAKVLDCIVLFADNAIQLAVIRYSNFTGQFALQSFKEDQELWNLVNSVNQDILPLAGDLLPVLFFVSIFIMLIGICFIAFPRYFADLLASLKVLKREKNCLDEEHPSESITRESLFKFILKWFISFIVLVVLFISTFLVYRCATDESSDNLDKESELMEEASIFVQKQKDFFKTNQSVASLKQLNIELKESEYFSYAISSNGMRWTAKNKEDWGKCPANTEWKISVSTTGFFETKINIYRKLPQNKHCADLTTEFKNVGKPLPKAK